LTSEKNWCDAGEMIVFTQIIRTVSQEQAGIGLLMQQDLNENGEPDEADSKVFIKSVVPGGPCDRDGGENKRYFPFGTFNTEWGRTATVRFSAQLPRAHWSGPV